MKFPNFANARTLAAICMRRFVFIIFLFLTNQSQACECKGRPNFLNSSLESSLIVLARIDLFRSFYDNSDRIPIVMQITIIETIKGKSKNSQIQIKGQEGKNCLEMLNKFQVGKTYVFALSPSYTANSNTIDSTMFDLSSCGEHWLSYNNKFVKGAITTDVKEYSKKIIDIQNKIDNYKGSDYDKVVGKLYKERQNLYKTQVQKMTYKSFKQKLSILVSNSS